MIVKICGIRSREMAEAAVRSGADFLGFIFAKSRRYIEPSLAAGIGAAAGSAKKVGVFVDAPPEEVNRIARLCHLDFVQLHGKESPAYCRSIEFPIIKAWRFGEDFSVEAANAYPAELLLIDSWQPGLAGGTGQCFSWELARVELAGLNKPFLLAGGIDAANVGEAVKLLTPYGIDVSGGVEENGSKSAAKIAEFMTAARRAERRIKE